MARNRRRARIVMLDLDSWDGLGEWGSSLRQHGLPVVRVVRPRRRWRIIRRLLDRWQFGASPVEVTGAPGRDPRVLDVLAPPTVDVQGPETQLGAMDELLPEDSPAKDLLRRVPDAIGQETLYDKWRMTQLAIQHGLQVPGSWTHAPPDTFPLVVKGRISAGGQDVEVVRNSQELDDALSRMQQRDNGGVFVQQVFDGPVLNAAGVAKNGVLLVHAVYEASPAPHDPFGPPVTLCVLDRPDILVELRGLIGALGYTGIFCIDYVQDTRNRIGMVDFNPRVFGGWLQLQLAGIDFIGAYRHSLDLAPTPAFHPLAPGTTLEVQLLAPRADRPGEAAHGARQSLRAIRGAARVTGWRFAALKSTRAIGRAAADAARSLRT